MLNLKEKKEKHVLLDKCILCRYILYIHHNNIHYSSYTFYIAFFAMLF